MVKEYLAVVRGVPELDRQVIDLPLGPALGSEVRIRMGPRDDELGLPARTEVRLIERLDGRALVSAHPKTGRQHQIRAHLCAIGHPVVGDKIYGVDEQLFIDFVEGSLEPGGWSLLELPRQALHAHRLELVHPGSGATCVLECPLPADLRDYLERHRAQG